MTDQFIEHFKTLSLKEQAVIINELTDLRRDHFNEIYKVVEIYNAHANISDVIRRCTAFETYHRGKPGTQGTNHVLVPRELYTAELGKALRDYFDGYSTGHTPAEWHDIIQGIINA